MSLIYYRKTYFINLKILQTLLYSKKLLITLNIFSYIFRMFMYDKYAKNRTFKLKNMQIYI